MSKILLEYDESTGYLTDANGMISTSPVFGYVGFPVDKEKTSSIKTTDILDIIKQGITPDEIIKLRNNGLL